jgi:CheY-like chemotaxis protein
MLPSSGAERNGDRPHRPDLVSYKTGKPLRVLIVEDDGVLALELTSMIEHWGGDAVGVATSAARAIRLAHELTPDLILMDVRLQGEIDGIEAAREIRDMQGCPIIFVTSHSDSDTLRRIKELGSLPVLSKPVSKAELLAAIKKVLGL